MGPASSFVLPVREYLLVALIAAVVTFLLVGLVRALAFRLGAVAYPRQRDVHVQPMPRMGGVAIYGGVLCGMFVAHQLPVLRAAFDFSNDPWGVIVAGGVIVLVGAIDDRFELDSLTKLDPSSAASVSASSDIPARRETAARVQAASPSHSR